MRNWVVEYARQAQRRITRAHVIQSLIAGVFILLAFWAMHTFHSELAIASLGASTFITFTSPHADASRPRTLIGGYCVGIVCGLLCGSLAKLIPDCLPFPGYVLACAAAVFLVMVTMAVLGFKHPPAAALSVAITLSAKSFVLSLAALCCVVFLCVLKEFFKKYLRDL